MNGKTNFDMGVLKGNVSPLIRQGRRYFRRFE